MITMKSKLGEVMKNPVGHDAITRLLHTLEIPKKTLNNPLVENMSLGHVAFLSQKKLSPSFWKSLLHLLNTGDNVAITDASIAKSIKTRAWWKEAVFYQIYPRSFRDGNGDGIGDLKGIMEKLDYLEDLGIDAIWLSPIYDSPNDDNGYDIRDYEKIQADFGDMDDFLKLVEEVHGRGMKLIMDLVVNHTSDEHEWFQKALSDPNSLYRDYYYLLPAFDDKGGEDGKTPPNNWISFFSGPAWNYYEKEKLWGLHLFSKKQMDLNWENADLRQDIIEMIKSWLERGVDGFRLDVINYISKTPGLPDGDDTIGEMIGFTGIENYFHGPRLHEYLRQLRKEAFDPFDAFTVGETPGIGLEAGKLFTSPGRKELDLIFSFDHLEIPGKTRFDDYEYDMNYYKHYLIDWTLHYGDSWSSLFVENHDNPRITSKIDPSHKYRKEVAKLLSVILLTIRGTPFIFQGQELGATNAKFSEVDELRDVESLNLYQESLDKGMTEDEAFAKVMSGSRDHARVPMKWEKDAYADSPENRMKETAPFWIKGEGDSPSVEEQEKDSRSVLSFYKKMIAFRKKNLAFVYGNTRFIDTKRKNYFAYYRSLAGNGFFVECNLSKEPIKSRGKGSAILSTDGFRSGELGPYVARIYPMT